MSIQEKIDYNYKTEKGRYLHSFTVVGESGPAVVPKDVHVRFYNCTIASLTLGGNNNIFIEGGTCGAITGSTSLLMARGTSFKGEVSLTASKADLYNITTIGAWRMKARSYLRADNSSFKTSDIGCDFQGGSQGRITRSTFTGHGTTAIKANGGSFVLVSNCSSIKGIKAMWALDRSVIQAIECALVEGTSTYAAHAETYARIELLNCAMVRGQVNAANGATHGFIVFNKCEQIIGNSDSAVFLDTNAGVEIRTFQTVRGQGNSAIRGVLMNSVFVIGGQIIKSDAKDGIELSNGGHGHAVSVQTIIGTGRNGIRLDQMSEFYVNDVVTITGMGSDGVYAGAKSLLQLYEVATVQGLGGSGANIGVESRFATFFVENLLGTAADGVTLGMDAYASIQGAAAITGTAGHGVKMGSNARLILSACLAVTGTAGDGINAGTGCQITASKGTAVSGLAGSGIVAGEGSTVNVVGQETVSGLAGDGIKATGSLVKLRKVESVSGLAGNGLRLTSSDLDAVLCTAISGTATGVLSVGDGVSQTRLRFDRCTVTGVSAGLNITDTLVESRGTTYTGPNAMLAETSHLRSVADAFTGNVTLESSIYEEWNTVITGIFTLSNGAMLGALGTATSSFVSTGSVLAVGASLGPLALASGFLGLFGGSATVTGTGGVISLGAGEPSAGVTYALVTTQRIKVRDLVGDYMEFSGSAVSLTALGTITGNATLYDWQ